MTESNAQNNPTTAASATASELRSYSQLQTLHEISETILESLDLSVMMDRILEKTLERGKFDIGLIRLLHPTEKSLEPVSSRGYRDAENIERQRKRAADPSSPRVIAQVIETKETRVEDLARVNGMRTFKREGVSTMVTVPLRTQKDVLGVLHLGSRSQRKIESHEIRLLEAIGTQTGIAVQKIRLFEAAERHAKEQQMLHEIAAATSQSLELNDLFEIAANKIVEATGRRRVNLRLKDAVSGTVSLVTYRGFTEKEVEALRRMSPHPMTEQVFASGKPLVINNGVGKYSALLPKTQSVAWIPVNASAQVVGVIGISDDQSRPFSQAEVDLLRAIGHVIGVAIENARLFGETKRNLEQMRALHEVGTAIVSTLDLHETLELLLKTIHGVLPYAASTVRLLNPENGVLEPAACRNIDVNQWRAESRGSGHGLPQLVFTSKAPLTVRNVQTDPRVRDVEIFRKHGLLSYLGLPLIVREEIFGVLSFYTNEEREFTVEEIDFLSTLASQAAIAIHNSQLYDQTRKQALQLEQSNKAKDELLQVMARQKEELSELNVGLEREIAERSRARAEIAAKNRDLETLLYVTSHDLREPLRAIENFSRIIHERYRDRLDEKGQDFMHRVIRGAQRLNRLLDDILTLSRSQRMEVPTEEVDGEVIVHEALRRLEDKIQLTQARVHVASGFEGLRVDRMWATQAIYNLIANALKFTRNGEPPEIEIAPHQPEGTAGRVLGIAVRDRGPGVAAEHAKRIFQLFQRAVGREVEGTGAGLAIVGQIAERHGGSAWVKSREGGGSEFIISFGKDKDSQGGDSQ
jgi:GAF domain-containing protein